MTNFISIKKITKIQLLAMIAFVNTAFAQLSTNRYYLPIPTIKTANALKSQFVLLAKPLFIHSKFYPKLDVKQSSIIIPAIVLVSDYFLKKKEESICVKKSFEELPKKVKHITISDLIKNETYVFTKEYNEQMNNLSKNEVEKFDSEKKLLQQLITNQ